VEQRELVRRAREGDHAAFTALVDVLLRRLDGAAWLILRDNELAQDAVQDALLRAWRDLPGLRDVDRFEAWVHRLTVHACLDLARRRRRRPIEVEISPLDAPAVTDTASQLADRELLDRALARLDDGHRAVVVLHHYLGMPFSEIAGTLSIPVGTVKSRMHHALRAMRASVGDEPVAASRASGGQVA